MIGILAVSGVFRSSTSVSKPLPPAIKTSNVMASGRSCCAFLTGFGPGLSHYNTIVRIQIAGEKFPGRDLVVDHQNQWFLAGAGDGGCSDGPLSRLAGSCGRFAALRQGKGKSAAFPRFALQPDLPALLFDQALGDRQS